VTYEKELGKIPSMPKHGMVDPTGAAHVGGGTFAGGTGTQFCSFCHCRKRSNSF